MLQGGILLVARIIILVNLTVDVLIGCYQSAGEAQRMSLTLVTAAPSPFTEFRRHFVGSQSAVLGLTIVGALVFAAAAAPVAGAAWAGRADAAGGSASSDVVQRRLSAGHR